MMAVIPITIEEEYKKNPDITPDDIVQFRSWLTNQPHLPSEHLTDIDLLLVYQCCEKSLQVAKEVLDLHFTLRTLFTQFFKDRAFDKKAEFALNTVLFTALSPSTAEGYRVFYARLLDPDPRNFNFVEGARAVMMIIDLLQREEGTWPGFVIVIDMDTVTMGHVARLDLMAVKKALYFLQECMLAKLKAVHFFRAPNFMDKVLTILKPFIRKDLLSLLHIHPTASDTIYNFISKEAFPKEEGGNFKDHITIRDETLNRLQANSAFYKDENKRRVNEALRREKNIKVEEQFGGVQGSFKKLAID